MMKHGINGLIMRHENIALIEGEHIATSTFETLIVYEDLLKEGLETANRLLADIKQLPIMQKPFPTNFSLLHDKSTTIKTIKGIAIAESNVSRENFRKDSSGNLYTLQDPTRFDTTIRRLKSGYTDYFLPTVETMYAIASATRYSPNCCSC